MGDRAGQKARERTRQADVMGACVAVGVGPIGGLGQAALAAADHAVQADLLGLAHLAAALQVTAAAVPVAGARCEAVARRLCRIATHCCLQLHPGFMLPALRMRLLKHNGAPQTLQPGTQVTRQYSCLCMRLVSCKPHSYALCARCQGRRHFRHYSRMLCTLLH